MQNAKFLECREIEHGFERMQTIEDVFPVLGAHAVRFAIIIVIALVFLPAIVLAESEDFLSSRELVERTFPAEPHDLQQDEWWRMVQLATVNEPVPGENFNPPVFVPPQEINAENAANIGAIIVAMIAVGENPQDFDGRNLVDELVTILNEDTAAVMSENAWLMPQIFYALTAADAVDYAQPQVLDALLDLQSEDGGWDTWGIGSGIEETAQLILMLSPFDGTQDALALARTFLVPLQLPCGGFPQGTWALDTFGPETTARVAEAIAALGECPLEWMFDDDPLLTPIHALKNAMTDDGGFEGAMSPAQAFIGLATAGLRINAFTNLRNPIEFPNVPIPLVYVPQNPPGNGGTGGGGTGGGGSVAPQTASITVSDPGGTGVMFTGEKNLAAAETAYSLLRRTGLAVNSRNTLIGVYVYGIDGIMERAHGPQSGWMFRVNGNFPGTAADRATIAAGDEVYWVFSREPASGGGFGGGGGGATDTQEETEDDEEYPAEESEYEPEYENEYEPETTEIEAAPEETEPEFTEPLRIAEFADISPADWFYPYVQYVYAQGLMEGTAAGIFSPQTNLTRAMLVTILWRHADTPLPESRTSFTDVLPGRWYSIAVAWALEDGIVQGFGDGFFKPGDNITREQFAAILHRYSPLPSARDNANLANFHDFAEISPWAASYIERAVENGIITGRTATSLAPRNTTTRAETAAMLTRAQNFCILPKSVRTAHSDNRGHVCKRSHSPEAGFCIQSHKKRGLLQILQQPRKEVREILNRLVTPIRWILHRRAPGATVDIFQKSSNIDTHIHIYTWMEVMINGWKTMP